MPHTLHLTPPCSAPSLYTSHLLAPSCPTPYTFGEGEAARHEGEGEGEGALQVRTRVAPTCPYLPCQSAIGNTLHLTPPCPEGARR